MDGVANTSGTRTHKEIRLSLDYVLKTRDRAADEITGVLVHEVVHCFQYDARGTCPGGLIEGVAGALCVLACARSTLIADLTPMGCRLRAPPRGPRAATLDTARGRRLGRGL